MIRKLFIFLGILLWIPQIFAQIAIGDWREHLPYNQAIAVDNNGENLIYCITPFSMFTYNTIDRNVEKYSSINSLSDVNLSAIEYDKNLHILIIGYENGNIDLIKDGKTINMSDIKRKLMVGSKRINKILCYNNTAYLSTDFGIVLLDIKNFEIIDTYYIGENGKAVKINDLTIDNQIIWASTEEGIYHADLNNPNIANFQNWHRDTIAGKTIANYSMIFKYHNQIITNKVGTTYGTDTLFAYSNNKWEYFLPYKNGPFTRLYPFGDTLIIGEEYGFTIYSNNLKDSSLVYTYNQSASDDELPRPNDFTIDHQGIIWIADETRSLVRNIKAWNFKIIQPTGPESKNAWALSSQGDHLFVATGGIQATGANMYTRKGVYEFYDQEWHSYNARSTAFFDTIDDISCVAINPANTQEAYIGSWGQGLFKMVNGEVVKVFDPTNSTLKEAGNYPGFVGIGGLAFDMENNLWVSNSGNSMGLLKMDASGKWSAFSLSPYVTEDQTSSIAIDDMNQKWIILPRGQGIVVYNDNFTPENPWDDKKTLLNGSTGSGHLPSSTVLSMALDHDGEMWVGTSKGVAVFYSPELIFSGLNYDAQQIYIEQEGISQYLLESEEVSAIAIDGANRKWFGTKNSGVFLMSADGSKQIHHFNSENSPLLSNTIYSIAINAISGEVFFGTEKGIVSYRSNATEGHETHQNVKVFPNPVRPEYHGNIAISGLVTDAKVKITDISGQLIYETTALGGQANWDGNNFQGERAATGVYLVFSTNEDGSETKVSKILFIH